MVNSSNIDPPSELVTGVHLLRLANHFTVKYLRYKGLCYILIGLTWVILDSPGRTAGISWLDVLTPVGVGIIWIVSGAMSSFTSFLKSPKVKRLGFFLLILVPFVLGSYFLVAYIAYFIPFIQTDGYSRGIVTTFWSWAAAVSAYIMSKIYVVTWVGDHSAKKVTQ